MDLNIPPGTPFEQGQHIQGTAQGQQGNGDGQGMMVAGKGAKDSSSSLADSSVRLPFLRLFFFCVFVLFSVCACVRGRNMCVCACVYLCSGRPLFLSLLAEKWVSVCVSLKLGHDARCSKWELV